MDISFKEKKFNDVKLIDVFDDVVKNTYGKENSRFYELIGRNEIFEYVNKKLDNYSEDSDEYKAYLEAYNILLSMPHDKIKEYFYLNICKLDEVPEDESDKELIYHFFKNTSNLNDKIEDKQDFIAKLSRLYNEGCEWIEKNREDFNNHYDTNEESDDDKDYEEDHDQEYDEECEEGEDDIDDNDLSEIEALFGGNGKFGFLTIDNIENYKSPSDDNDDDENYEEDHDQEYDENEEYVDEEECEEGEDDIDDNDLSALENLFNGNGKFRFLTIDNIENYKSPSDNDNDDKKDED